MSDGFLNGPQLAALEKAIAQARDAPGVHRELIPNGEAVAYQYHDGIQWAVNRGERNVACGSCPRTPQAD